MHRHSRFHLLFKYRSSRYEIIPKQRKHELLICHKAYFLLEVRLRPSSGLISLQHKDSCTYTVLACDEREILTLILPWYTSPCQRSIAHTERMWVKQMHVNLTKSTFHMSWCVCVFKQKYHWSHVSWHHTKDYWTTQALTRVLKLNGRCMEQRQEPSFDVRLQGKVLIATL